MTEVETTRISTRGQVVIPQSIREKVHLEAGQLFVVYGEDDTIVLKRIKTPDAEEMQQLLSWGEAYAEEEGITREDIEQAISELRDEAQSTVAGDEPGEASLDGPLTPILSPSTQIPGA